MRVYNVLKRFGGNIYAAGVESLKSLRRKGELLRKKAKKFQNL